MKRKLTLTAIAVFILFINQVSGQGCVAIRSNGNSCSRMTPGQDKGWNFNFNTRYFRSYKHFVGTEEHKERVENGTEVINYSFSWDLTLTRQFNKYWSLSVGLPVISNVRSSMYEHYGNNSSSPNARNNTRSFGIGDLRITGYRWLFDPARSHKGNLQVGLGLKLPTGDYNYQDYFYKNDTTTLLGPVDQSIQLGDGGTGFITELNGFYNFSHKLGAYGNFFYLINPREQNGVSTSRGSATSSLAMQYFTNTMSVPDQYMARAGMNYMTGIFSFSGGLRVEGIPSSDLIGGDKGFRRPGYVVSAEPVVAVSSKKASWYLSVPVALVRNRVQSYSDKLRTAATGSHVQGDAAFADYLVNVGMSVRF